MESAKQIIRQFVPVKTTSTFYQDGKITPEEFVAAGFYFCSSPNHFRIFSGDLLSRQCPTWKWFLLIIYYAYFFIYLLLSILGNLVTQKRLIPSSHLTSNFSSSATFLAAHAQDLLTTQIC